MSPKTLQFPDKWFVGLTHDEICRHFLIAKLQILRSELQFLQDNKKRRKKRANTMVIQEEDIQEEE